MSMDLAVTGDYERVLVAIVRLLPPDRAGQLVDFARFLEAQILSEELLQQEDALAIETDNARWDALLDTEEAQAVLEKLATEALAEHRAGKTRPMAFNDGGRIVPG